MKPPDWVGIGAMKAGTTWWHDVICQHPDVAMAGMGGPGTYDPEHGDVHHKEVRGFDRHAYRGPPDNWTDYHACFPDDGRLVGEWTPTYLDQFWAPAMLRAAAPDARLLVILRDPVDRFEAEVRHYMKWPDSADRPIDLDWTMWHELAWSHSLYARHLADWVDVWPADRLLVLQYERCRVDFEGQAAATYRHLGLDDSFQPVNRRLLPSTADVGWSVPDAVAASLRRSLRADTARLCAMFGDAINPDLWSM